MRYKNKAFKVRENSIKCYLATNICRKTIINPTNFNIKKRYGIVFFRLLSTSQSGER